MLQTRYSDNHVRDWMIAKRDEKEVHRSLSQELLQKSAAEKASEEIEAAKTHLQDRAEQIESKAQQWHQTVDTHHQQAIEHRTQVLLAHAERIEQLAMLLAMLIHCLQNASQNLHLLTMLAIAKTLQTTVQEPWQPG